MTILIAPFYYSHQGKSIYQLYLSKVTMVQNSEHESCFCHSQLRSSSWLKSVASPACMMGISEPWTENARSTGHTARGSRKSQTPWHPSGFSLTYWAWWHWVSSSFISFKIHTLPNEHIRFHQLALKFCFFNPETPIPSCHPLLSPTVRI